MDGGAWWLQSMGLLRVGHDSMTSLSLFTFMHWRRKWQPTQCSCLESPRDGGAWWAAVYGAAQSWTRLKRLSSSSRFDSCIRKIPWRREWQSTQVLLPGEFHGQRSLAGYSLWACQELDMTKRISVFKFSCFTAIFSLHTNLS